MSLSFEEMNCEERTSWLKRVSEAVEEKTSFCKAASSRSFRAYDVAETAPKEYICPISLELMKDPVLLVESGQVYDRSSIEGWFKSGKSTCPVSGNPFASYGLLGCEGAYLGKKVKKMRLSSIFPLRSAIQSYADAQNIELHPIESTSEQEESPPTEDELTGVLFEGVSVYDVRGIWQLVATDDSTEQKTSALRLLADMARFGDASQRKRVHRIIKVDKVIGIYRNEEGSLKIQAARLLLHLPGRYFDLFGKVKLLKLNSEVLREEILLKIWSYCYRHRSKMLEVASILEKLDSAEMVSVCRKIADPTENSDISEESRTCATLLLCCGAFRPTVREILIQQEVIPLLVHFLNGSPNVGFRFCLMKALQYICEDAVGREQVLRAGGTRIFVMHLPPRNNSVHYTTRVFLDWFSWVTVAETAVKALYYLSFTAQARTEMRTTATVKALRLIFNSSHFSDHARARYLTTLLARLASSTTH